MKKLQGFTKLFSHMDDLFEQIDRAGPFSVGEQVEVDGKVFTVTEARCSHVTMYSGQRWRDVGIWFKSIWHRIF